MPIGYNILYIITQSDLGGAQRSTLNLTREFNGQLAAGREKNELFVEAEKLGIVSHQLKFLKRKINPFFDLLALFEIYFLIRRLKPDIVHLNSTKAGILGSIAGKLAGTKVVFTARGFVFNEPRNFLVTKFFIFLEKFASLFRDKIITVSEADRNSALQHNLKYPNKIVTINNALKSLTFLGKVEAKKTLGVADNKIILGTIANFYPTKGLDILLQALAKINFKNFELIIIGSGPLENDLRELCQKLNLNNVVKFAGQIKNASNLLKAFDIFILSSRKEGFPLVLLEAMQAGLPIIATDVGGNKEALGSAGVLVPSQNPEALVRAINQLLTNSDSRIQLSSQALAQSKKFSYDEFVSKVSAVYDSLKTQ